MNNIKIKVCGINNSENLAELINICPDYLGFIFYPRSKRFVDEKIKRDVISLIPDTIKKVGVFVNETRENVIQVKTEWGLDFVQLHGDESPGYCRFLKEKDVRVIKAFRVKDSLKELNIRTFNEYCDYYLFDTSTPLYGGSGNKFDWSVFRDYDENKYFFLSGGIGPDDIDGLLQFNHRMLHAADVNSKFETRPGTKNARDLKIFIQQLRQEEYNI